MQMLMIGFAGFGAGAINALVGSGTLITFPTLVAIGYAPVTSTMSNTIGLVAGHMSGTWAIAPSCVVSGTGCAGRSLPPSPELRWARCCFCTCPRKIFGMVVPALLVLALLLVVVGPWIQSWARRRAEQAGGSIEHIAVGRMAAVVLGTFAVGLYGGYFTAAQGILLVGVMGALLPESVQRMNAAKNALSLVVNLVAAIGYTFVACDRISWPVAGAIAAGSLLGGSLGARYARRLSPKVLRATIVVVGLIGLYRLLMA
ncbi:sulfite exporter TauE/SafE family protein [Mycobacterium kansasii 732]|nr:sulfite exporter TauE/SafE family protein [Mycobacterium kansasii 732]